MQVSVQSTEHLTKCLRIEIPEEDIATEIRNRLRTMQRTTQIRGFRRGKVPLNLIQKQYGATVRREVLADSMQDSLNQAIKQENLRPASKPEIEDVTSGQAEGLAFTAKMEIFPEINIAPFSQLVIEKLICHVSADDVSKMIEMIRKQHSKAKVVDRVAALGDVVVIDFIGYVNGQTFSGGSGKDVSLELGSKTFIKGFEDGLIGVSAGDKKSLNLIFPEPYGKPELAGKDVEFKIDITSVNTPILPELNEEFFSTLGIVSGGIDAFKTELLKNMQRESEQISKHKLKASVIESLYQANTIDLPPSLIASEVDRLQQLHKTQLQQQGLDAKDMQVADPLVLKPQAEKQLGIQLLFANIIETNNIKVEPSKVRAVVENIAASYDHPEEVINWYYSDKNQLAKVEGLVLEEEVVEWIAQKAQINEIEVTFDALKNKEQTNIN